MKNTIPIFAITSILNIGLSTMIFKIVISIICFSCSCTNSSNYTNMNTIYDFEARTFCIVLGVSFCFLVILSIKKIHICIFFISIRDLTATLIMIIACYTSRIDFREDYSFLKTFIVILVMVN